MPIYEYVCSKCNTRFELLRPISQAGEDVECSQCHGRAERTLSRFACYTKDSTGLTLPAGGSACSSCSTPSSCDTCSP